MDLALEISRPGSGLIWSPTQQCFLNIAIKKHSAAELASHSASSAAASSFPSELYLNKEELASLALVVGVQGIRTIESQLLSLLAEQVGCSSTYSNTTNAPSPSPYHRHIIVSSSADTHRSPVHRGEQAVHHPVRAGLLPERQRGLQHPQTGRAVRCAEDHRHRARHERCKRESSISISSSLNHCALSICLSM